MIVEEFQRVSGRGDVLCVRYDDGDYCFKVGDFVYCSGDVWQVIGVEMMEALTDPPTIKNRVSLVVIRHSNVKR